MKSIGFTVGDHRADRNGGSKKGKRGKGKGSKRVFTPPAAMVGMVEGPLVPFTLHEVSCARIYGAFLFVTHANSRMESKRGVAALMAIW